LLKFWTNIGHFAFLSARLGGLGAMYTVHPRFNGKTSYLSLLNFFC